MMKLINLKLVFFALLCTLLSFTANADIAEDRAALDKIFKDGNWKEALDLGRQVHVYHGCKGHLRPYWMQKTHNREVRPLISGGQNSSKLAKTAFPQTWLKLPSLEKRKPKTTSL
jgi:hypothetical protein